MLEVSHQHGLMEKRLNHLLLLGFVYYELTIETEKRFNDVIESDVTASTHLVYIVAAITDALIEQSGEIF